MKLREFMASSLPRVRGRKKKGEGTVPDSSSSVTGSVTAAAATAVAASTASGAQYPAKLGGATTNNTDTADLSSTPCKAAKSEGSGNWFQFNESRFAFLERLVGKESPVKRLFEPREHRQALAARSRSPAPVTTTTTTTTTQRKSCSPRRLAEREGSDGEPRRRVSSASVERGSGLYEREEVIQGYRALWCQCPTDRASCQCAAARQLSWVCGGSCPSQRRYRTDPDAASLYSQGCYGYAESVGSYESTPGSQRGPRSRSRIRTNPWLPSPRPSPYSVRSLSSPCASSRSPSPPSSSSPPSAHPSSSDSTSPLTSQDVRDSHHAPQRHHYRRHRRHHSEANATELVRDYCYDTPLTDTEQYYSTLDSGIGETSTSPDEKDKDKENTLLKHTSAPATKKHHVKRKSSDRDSHFFSQFRGFAVFTGGSTPSPSPKFRSKLRSKTAKSSSSVQPSSSRGVVANRDSKFWDSDSSISPPCPSKNLTQRSPAKPPRFGARGPDLLWDCDDDNNNNNTNNYNNTHSSYVASHHGSSERFQKTEKTGFFSSRRFFQKDIKAPPELAFDRQGFHNSTASSHPSSPCCDDIGVITSNIEQLAHNLSHEYEEALNASFCSTASSEPPAQVEEDGCASLRALYNIDAERKVGLLPQDYRELQAEHLRTEARKEAPSALREDLQNIVGAEHRDQSRDATENQYLYAAPLVDASVQTDFVDDDEEDNSGSDWLPSTESGSDWLTPSNGSGSDWPVSGGSGCDWLVGEESECATEEEVEGGVKEEEQEEATNAAEGGKVWMIPDVMQDSTDTGYSSLSRDGRVTIDNHHNQGNHATTTDIDSSDSAAERNPSKTPSDIYASQKARENRFVSNGAKMRCDKEITAVSRTSGVSESANSTPDSETELINERTGLASLGTIPKSHRSHLRYNQDTSFGDSFDSADDHCRGSELFTCTLNLDTEGKKCFVQFRHHHYGLKTKKKTASQQSIKTKKSDGSTDTRCSCSDDSSNHNKVNLCPGSKSDPHQPDCSNVIPYPYDVTRFGDVTVPLEERKRLGSVSPCCPRSGTVSSHPSKPHKKTPTRLPPPPLTNTPVFSAHIDSDDDDDENDFCSCSSPNESMTSSVIFNDVTNKKPEKAKTPSFFSRFSKKARQEAAAASLSSSRSATANENGEKASKKQEKVGQAHIPCSQNMPSYKPSEEGVNSFSSGPLEALCGRKKRSDSQPMPATQLPHRHPTRPHRSGKGFHSHATHNCNSDVCWGFENTPVNGQSLDLNTHQLDLGCFDEGLNFDLSRLGNRGVDRSRSRLNSDSSQHDADLAICSADGTESTQSSRGFTRSGRDLAEGGRDFGLDGTKELGSGRSLDEVVASLEDKVQYLRHGKHAVQRKIREAREEERVRQQHRLRFQKLLDIHRKRVLLQTLQDLRHKLVSQSSRLQASYSTVLDIQKGPV